MELSKAGVLTPPEDLPTTTEEKDTPPSKEGRPTTMEEKDTLQSREDKLRQAKEHLQLTKENLRVARPGDGMCPSRWEQILGQCASRDLPVGHPLSEEDLAN